jgi:hypothetical protein
MGKMILLLFYFIFILIYFTFSFQYTFLSPMLLNFPPHPACDHCRATHPIGPLTAPPSGPPSLYPYISLLFCTLKMEEAVYSETPVFIYSNTWYHPRRQQS